MARIAFEKIMAGLEDALAYADNDTSRGSAHQVQVEDIDITRLRRSSVCLKTSLPLSSD